MSTTIIDVIKQHAQAEPDKTACIFLEDGSNPSRALTYQELNTQAQQIAMQLLETVNPGDRVLLFYPNSLDYILGLLACFYAGVIAVPAYPPGNSYHLKRLIAIADDAKAAAILITTKVAQQVQRFGRLPKQLAKTPQIMTDRLLPRGYEKDLPEIKPSDLAIMQYTSGSTGNPKGVMISHENIMVNEAMIAEGTGHDSQAVYLGWLPFYHDMGLICNVLQPLYLGVTAYFMPPLKFVQRPLRWLQAISKYKITISGAPNFAYELCFQKISASQKQDLDLSSWQVAFCGAEPIRASTLDAFAESFAASGFKRQAFAPCYGLAEATLIVTGAHSESEPTMLSINKTALEKNQIEIMPLYAEKSKTLVSSGKVLLDETICIVDPKTLKICAPGDVGEVWVQGKHVAKGYWQKPEKDNANFNAYTADQQGPFMRSGDLGFYYQDRLYITGRLKDMIIIRGRNHYPQDLEYTASIAHPTLNPDSTAAFAIEHKEQEQLIIMQEVAAAAYKTVDKDILETAIRDAVISAHEICPYDIVLVRPGEIPKTSSGKVQRAACRQEYLEKYKI